MGTYDMQNVDGAAGYQYQALSRRDSSTYIGAVYAPVASGQAGAPQYKEYQQQDSYRLSSSAVGSFWWFSSKEHRSAEYETVANKASRNEIKASFDRAKGMVDSWLEREPLRKDLLEGFQKRLEALSSHVLSPLLEMDSASYQAEQADLDKRLKIALSPGERATLRRSKNALSIAQKAPNTPSGKAERRKAQVIADRAVELVAALSAEVFDADKAQKALNDFSYLARDSNYSRGAQKAIHAFISVALIITGIALVAVGYAILLVPALALVIPGPFITIGCFFLAMGKCVGLFTDASTVEVIKAAEKIIKARSPKPELSKQEQASGSPDAGRGNKEAPGTLDATDNLYVSVYPQMS